MTPDKRMRTLTKPINSHCSIPDVRPSKIVQVRAKEVNVLTERRLWRPDKRVHIVIPRAKVMMMTRSSGVCIRPPGMRDGLTTYLNLRLSLTCLNPRTRACASPNS